MHGFRIEVSRTQGFFGPAWSVDLMSRDYGFRYRLRDMRGRNARSTLEEACATAELLARNAIEMDVLGKRLSFFQPHSPAGAILSACAGAAPQAVRGFTVPGGTIRPETYDALAPFVREANQSIDRLFAEGGESSFAYWVEQIEKGEYGYFFPVQPGADIRTRPRFGRKAPLLWRREAGPDLSCRGDSHRAPGHAPAALPSREKRREARLQDALSTVRKELLPDISDAAARREIEERAARIEADMQAQDRARRERIARDRADIELHALEQIMRLRPQVS